MPTTPRTGFCAEVGFGANARDARHRWRKHEHRRHGGGMRLPTHDGRVRVLLPKPRTRGDSLAQIGAIKDAAEALGDRDMISIVDTVHGREVRSWEPQADAFVLSLTVTRSP